MWWSSASSSAPEHGSAVVWIGAELDELFVVADRIVVLAGGRITGEVPHCRSTVLRSASP